MAITIGEAEMHDIASGAAILGTGGGGDPYIGKLMALTAIRKNGPVRLLEKYHGRKADATMPIEAGGVNSTIPFVVAAKTGLPVIDGDGMGRAFPELQMETFSVYGIPGSPIAIHDEKGNSAVLNAVDN